MSKGATFHEGKGNGSKQTFAIQFSHWFFMNCQESNNLIFHLLLFYSFSSPVGGFYFLDCAVIIRRKPPLQWTMRITTNKLLVYCWCYCIFIRCAVSVLLASYNVSPFCYRWNTVALLPTCFWGSSPALGVWYEAVRHSARKKNAVAMCHCDMAICHATSFFEFFFPFPKENKDLSTK